MLRKKLELKIEEDKRISFSDYMEMILFDKEYGFYEREQVFGKEGHYITSPLVSEHFSQCIAKNFIEVYKQEKLENIIEYGAGNAKLALDLIQYLKNRQTLPTKYYFFEKSSRLINEQKMAIKELELDDAIDFVWVNKYEDLPKEAFIIANELFDCIPTDLIMYKNYHYYKAYIDETFKISWHKYDFLSQTSSKYLSLPKKLEDKYIFEFSLGQYEIIKNITRYIDKAYFVIFDYGYSADELYIKDRISGTVTCINNHISDFDPLKHMGQKDVSSFVNFSYLRNILESKKWDVNAFMSQANYLLSFDILNNINIDNLDEVGAIKKLIMPNQMGEIFKVLISQKGINKISDKNFSKNDIIKL